MADFLHFGRPKIYNQLELFFQKMKNIIHTGILPTLYHMARGPLGLGSCHLILDGSSHFLLNILWTTSLKPSGCSQNMLSSNFDDLYM